MKKILCIFISGLFVLLIAVTAFAATTTYTCAVMDDTYLDQRDPNDNSGTSTRMVIAGNSGIAEVARAIIRFNIPPFISAGHIQSATLYLTRRSGVDLDIYIHPVTPPAGSKWFEKDLFAPDTSQLIWGATWNDHGGTYAGATWSTPGGDYDSTESESATIGSGHNSIDITTLLTDNLDTIRKYGILMKAQDETPDEFCSIYSKDNGADEPYLELEVDLGIPDNEKMCPVVADVYIDNGGTSDPEYIDYNFNWKTRLLVSWHASHGTARGLWKFEIPGVIAAIDIDSATLYLSGSQHAITWNQFVVDCYGLNDPFDEETDSWNSLAGGDYDTSVVSSGTIYQTALPGTPSPNWRAEIDVTDLLSGNLDKVRDNGILMKRATESGDNKHQNIASRECYDDTDVPAYLKIVVEPTLISLASFEAEPASERVTLKWVTESEIDNAGFNIYRSEAGGEYVKINQEIIPASGGAAKGASYKFTDTAVKNRTTYSYKLEDIDTNGTATQHGPVSATPRLIYIFK